MSSDTVKPFDLDHSRAIEFSRELAERTEQEHAQLFDEFCKTFRAVQAEISKFIVGLEGVVEELLVALFSGGNVLLEGVPGIGKTCLVRVMAKVMQLGFSRIQCTPDLMPADVIGTNMVLQTEAGERHFAFQKGPVFTNLLLVDEINRATPKTQSALLESMQEHAVTAAGTRYPMDEPFFVVGTQNPLEMEGTYPLPEAQLDRFLFKINFPFPSVDELCLISSRTTTTYESGIQEVVSGEEILRMQGVVRLVPIAPHIERYAASLVSASHPEHPEVAPLAKRYVRYGASPRGMQAIVLAAKIRALLHDRYNVATDDMKEVAKPALRHRIIRNFEAEAEQLDTDQIVEDIIKHVDQTVDAELAVA